MTNNNTSNKLAGMEVTSAVDATKNSDSAQEPDESLYSRQIYTIGIDAMRKMARSSVLIIGMRGVGVEIAKNVILAGVKSVFIYDPASVVSSDLSSQFFLSESDIGSRRDVASKDKLAELNPYVHVDLLPIASTTASASEKDLYCSEPLLAAISSKAYNVIVCTSISTDIMLTLNDAARSAGAAFIAADARGLAAFGFCDFGADFSVLDATGETPRSGMIAAISHDTDGVVTCLDDARHGLQDGDYVRISEVEGLNGINNASAPFKVRVLGPFTFSIGDTSNFDGAYARGGIYTEVHVPFSVSFKTMRESLPAPECVITDFAKLESSTHLHIAFHALSAYMREHSGRVPVPQCPDDAARLFNLAQQFASNTMSPPVEANKEFIETFAMQCAGDLCPIAAVIGGLMAQEVLKACSGKLQPLKQYIYYDGFEALPKNIKNDYQVPAPEDFAPSGSRYDGQIAVFGRTLQSFIAASHVFLVGAGAIGCEMLKNWALMGVACDKSQSGSIIVTDMDTIEKSNLNRQFLFRSRDVGKLKSQTAADSVRRINPNVSIKAFCERVGPETEATFNSNFWGQLDAVANALDNVEARRYMDRRCVFFRKALFESGTLGVKGNTQVVIPHVTESYSSSTDPPEASVPLCTLKNFPNQIEHTIQWARDTFEGLFVQPITHAQFYLTNPKYIDEVMRNSETTLEALSAIQSSLSTEKPATFADCIAWARFKFEELFVNNIKQLLFNFPRDAVTSTGALFWSGPKRVPEIIEFSASNPLHIEFIICASLLRAANFGIKSYTDESGCEKPLSSGHNNKNIKNQSSYFVKMVSAIHPPEFKPRANVSIHANDEEAKAAQEAMQSRQRGGNNDNSDNDIDLDSYLKGLPEAGSFAASPDATNLYPAVFEKDDDSNYHIDIIASCSNIRAATYGIASADRFKTKQIAGKIIPAIATTTALVTGFVCIEMYKYFQDLMLKRTKDMNSSATKTTSSSAQTTTTTTTAAAATAAAPGGSGGRNSNSNIERYRNTFLSLAGPLIAASEPIAASKQKYNNIEFTLWDRFEFNDMPIGALIDMFRAQHNLDICMMSCGVSMIYSFFMPKSKMTERKSQTVWQALEAINNAPLAPHIKEVVIEVCCNDPEGEDVEVPYILVRQGN